MGDLLTLIAAIIVLAIIIWLLYTIASINECIHRIDKYFEWHSQIEDRRYVAQFPDVARDREKRAAEAQAKVDAKKPKPKPKKEPVFRAEPVVPDMPDDFALPK